MTWGNLYLFIFYVVGLFCSREPVKALPFFLEARSHDVSAEWAKPGLSSEVEVGRTRLGLQSTFCACLCVPIEEFASAGDNTGKLWNLNKNKVSRDCKLPKLVNSDLK